jgi:crotonobetainyl-CoA:carnitine CoA-transferase CaiB-like acyl-CoA transferase
LASDPRFATNSDRCDSRDILDEVIGSWCAKHDLEHIQRIADEAGIGNSRYNKPSEVVAHPHLGARRRWRTVDTPKGEIAALLPPPVISGFEQPMGAVPGLGEHTHSILRELGFADRQIDEFRRDGTVGR